MWLFAILQTLNMVTNKRADDYFQRESEQMAKKRKSRRNSRSKNTRTASSIKILPLKCYILAWICKKNYGPLSQNSGSAPGVIIILLSLASFLEREKQFWMLFPLFYLKGIVAVCDGEYRAIDDSQVIVPVSLKWEHFCQLIQSLTWLLAQCSGLGIKMYTV